MTPVCLSHSNLQKIPLYNQVRWASWLPANQSAAMISSSQSVSSSPSIPLQWKNFTLKLLKASKSKYFSAWRHHLWPYYSQSACARNPRAAVDWLRWRRRRLPGQVEECRRRRGAGRKRRGARKVDLPVAQLLAPNALYYLLRLESPVSLGRIVEEAKKCHRRQTSKWSTWLEERRGIWVISTWNFGTDMIGATLNPLRPCLPQEQKWRILSPVDASYWHISKHFRRKRRFLARWISLESPFFTDKTGFKVQRQVSMMNT